MSNRILPGIGTAVLPVTTPPITLIVTTCPELTEVSVGRKSTAPITGFYDKVAKTANVKLLLADYEALKNAVSGGASVSINYVYNEADDKVVSFSWTPLAAVAVARASTTSVVPPSGINAAPAPEEEVAEIA